MGIKKYKNLIWDLDDTILKCGIYYQNCKDEFVRFQHTRTKIGPDIILKILNNIDIACTDLPNGFGKDRFPRSFQAASTALDIIRGCDVNKEAAIKSFYIGESVFYAQYDPFPDAIETLRECKNVGFSMYMLTKGERSVQRYKIHKHGLDEIFFVDPKWKEDNSYAPATVHIVHRKTARELKDLIINHALDPELTLFIGDSIRDDIGSANGAGIDSVLVQSGKPPWAYENVDNKPTYIVDSITELPNFIQVV